MRHLGDITKINGAEIPLVDVITGGSPCQDLSIAGKRTGLDGARSGLFMEQIRVTKEMRQSDRHSARTGVFIRPRFMVWENVPGAFSSNKGEDFRAVLEETIKIVEPEAPPVSVPAKGWPTSGCLYDDLGRWSVAWRVHDAQFWGVPQRRRRIALVADFGGLAALEVLFERKGLRGDFGESEQAREEAPQGNENGAYPAIARSLTARHDGSPYIDRESKIVCANPWDSQAERVYYGDGAWHSLNSNSGGGQSRDAVYDARGNGDGKTVCTLTGDHQNRVTDYTALCVGNLLDGKDIAGALMARDYKGVGRDDCLDRAIYCLEKDISHTLKAKANCDFRKDSETYPVTQGKVRRLTPLECERLQGYPDGWTDIGDYTDTKGKRCKTSDSARYKALGNSIALPFWKWLLKRISAQYERDATLGSLFDGIGGFPYLWEQINGKGSALWASEVEEFCIAVTKRRLGG